MVYQIHGTVKLENEAEMKNIRYFKPEIRNKIYVFISWSIPVNSQRKMMITAKFMGGSVAEWLERRI